MWQMRAEPRYRRAQDVPSPDRSSGTTRRQMTSPHPHNLDFRTLHQHVAVRMLKR
jgi:hypothetical protein